MPPHTVTHNYNTKMRTKALLCAASLLAVGALSAMAQSNVYSLNVVGYVNVPLHEGFNQVGNPLDLDGTGTNNTLATALSSNVPLNTVVYEFNGSGYAQFAYASVKGQPAAWTPNGPLNPGMGVWVKIPAGAYGGTTQNVTTVGNVLQGALQNKNIPAGSGFGMLASMAPISGGITTALQYAAKTNDVLYLYNGSGYAQYAYASVKGSAPSWQPSEPSINVGQGFWLKFNYPGSTWTQNFTVQ